MEVTVNKLLISSKMSVESAHLPPSSMLQSDYFTDPKNLPNVCVFELDPHHSLRTVCWTVQDATAGNRCRRRDGQLHGSTFNTCEQYPAGLHPITTLPLWTPITVDIAKLLLTPTLHVIVHVCLRCVYLQLFELVHVILSLS